MSKSFHVAVASKLSAIDALGVQFTSYAIATGATFPNVTLPNFAVRGSNSRILADGCLIDWLPIVTDEDRAGWEAYALEHGNDWWDEAKVMGPALRHQQDVRFGLIEEGVAVTDSNVTAPPEPPIPEQIVGGHPETGERRVEPEGSGPFLPVFQVSPILPGQTFNINFNMLSRPIYAGGLQAALKSSKAVFDTAIDLRDPNSDTDWTSASDLFLFILTYSQYRHQISDFSSDPVTNMMYPVFDNFSPERKLVGVILTSLYWNLYFQNILPESAIGIVAVLENTQGQMFTYEINGSEVTFLGPGDRHDTAYDEYEVLEDVMERIKENAGPSNTAFTEVTLDDEYNKYILRVYPSKTMEESYESDEPIYFAIIVACTFVFTTLIFGIYDFIVERRQRKVFNRAVASGTILQSLFPEQIREKLIEETKQKVQPEQSQKSSTNTSWLTKDSPGGGATLEHMLEKEKIGGNIVSTAAKPICSKYEAATVL